MWVIWAEANAVRAHLYHCQEQQNGAIHMQGLLKP